MNDTFCFFHYTKEQQTPKRNNVGILPMHISSSVSASPMHWNLNSFSDSANFLFAVDKSVKDVMRCVKFLQTRIAQGDKTTNDQSESERTCTVLWKLCGVWVFQDIREFSEWMRKRDCKGENVQKGKLRRERMSPEVPKNKYCLSWNENLAGQIIN